MRPLLDVTCSEKVRFLFKVQDERCRKQSVFSDRSFRSVSYLAARNYWQDEEQIKKCTAVDVHDPRPRPLCKTRGDSSAFSTFVRYGTLESAVGTVRMKYAYFVACYTKH